MVSPTINYLGCSSALAEPLDFEEFEGDENAVDLRAYHTLGGVIHFNLVQIPPQPKTIKQWTMTRRKNIHELRISLK